MQENLTYKCIHRIFEEQASKNPDAIAVIYKDTYLSYGELNRHANHLAHHLQDLGVGPEVRVGLLLERSLELIVGILGILKAGGAYVALDTSYPRERLSFLLSDIHAPVLLTLQRLVEHLPPNNRDHCILLDTIWQSKQYEHVDNNPISNVCSENTAYITYTSGSTGTPKGVMIAHKSISGFLFNVDYLQLDSEQVFLQSSSISWDAFTMELWAPLLHGGRCALYSGENLVLEELGNAIQAYSVTTLSMAPSLFNIIIEAKPNILRGVRQVLLGGEAPSVSHIRQSLTLWPEMRLVNGYGPSECTVLAICYTIPHFFDHKFSSISIGKTIGDRYTYILDFYLQPVPIGLPGEIYIGGVGVGRGYLNRPDLTAERFVPDPFSTEAGSRLYRTGDLARYHADGNIEFLGRIDDQIKLRGIRIELGEVEVTLRRHPTIKDVVVSVRGDTPEEKQLVAYVVSDHSLTQDLLKEVRQHLRSYLPEYMIPSVFVSLESLPLSPNGKVNRHALPAPETLLPLKERSYKAPGTLIEETLTQIWSELLRREQVSIYDDFFELGGHSLLATRLVSRIHTAFQVKIPLLALFEAPTIAHLATYIEQRYQTEVSHLPSILPISRDQLLPLSFAQSRLWFLEQLMSATPVYNIPNIFYLRGTLQIEILQQSFNELLSRHEILRTTFAMVDEIAVQVVAPTSTLMLSVKDLTLYPPDHRQAERERLIAQEALRPFDLSCDFPVRVTLLRLQSDEYILLLTMHHIAFDGWSAAIFMQELSTLYEAYIAGKPSPLPNLPIQYADFAFWQRQWLQGGVMDAQLTYWKQQLAGAPAILQLPTDRPRPAVQTFRGAWQSLELSQSLTTQLKHFSQQEGVTLFMTLLTAFKILLCRYTGQVDIIVGTPIANRSHHELEALIGFFVNTLVLRTDLSGNPSFRTLLKRVRQVTLEAYEHQDVPFEKLVEELHPERNLSYQPLFQVVFALQNLPPATLILPGLTVETLEVAASVAKFDLTVTIQESNSGFSCIFDYNSDLYNYSTISHMIQHFKIILGNILDNADFCLSDFLSLTIEEKNLLLIKHNETSADYPKDKCVHELFEAQVKKTPTAVAVTCEDEQITYRDLNQQANKLAHYLRKLCISPEVPVGICMERSLEMIVGLLGIFKAGGAYVPLDPDYPKNRLEFIINDTGIPVIMTQQKLLLLLPEYNGRVLCLDTDMKKDFLESEQDLINVASADNLAYILYTSGSTGKPKGVMINHGSLVNYLYWFNETLLDATVQNFPLTSRLTFDTALKQLFTRLIRGDAVWIISKSPITQPIVLLHALSTRQNVGFNCVPSLWATMLDVMQSNSIPNLNKSLSNLFISGEHFDRNLVDRTLSLLPHLRIWNIYGQTEVTANASYAEVVDEVAISIGSPIANVQVYVLDAYMRPVPIMVPGELYVGGAGLARGYLNRPDLTAECFIPNPFGDKSGERLYKTGDIVRYMSNGKMEYIGRSDHQIKIRGFRIELKEIEVALTEYSAFQECTVTVKNNSLKGKYLVAYLVLKQETNFIMRDLRSFLNNRLPNYMVPSKIIVLDSLPRMSSGKIDHLSLPDPDHILSQEQKKRVMPRNTEERQLCQIWEDCLGVRPIGVTDNFFELGGHSLLAFRLIVQIQKRFNQNLTLDALFQDPTIEHLASVLRHKNSVTAQPPLVEISPTGMKKPLFFVHPIGGTVLCYDDLARSLAPDQPFYGFQASGLNEGEILYSRIEDMAAHYIKSLFLLQPRGPYFLGGWSMGGIVAFEMAQQLCMQGYEIALLALLDSHIPNNIGKYIYVDDTEILKYFLDNLQQFYTEPHPIFQHEDFKHLESSEQLRILQNQEYLTKLESSGVDAAQIYRLFHVFKSNALALQTYIPLAYHQPIILFQAEEQLFEDHQSSLEKWTELALGGIETHVIPSDHYDIVKSPSVQLVAHLLKAYLDSAQG